MATKKRQLELMGQVPLFSECSKKELDLIAQVGRTVERSEGDVIVAEGASGVGFHLIIEGSAVVTRGGRKINELGAGDYFGEVSLIDEGPRSATVTATSSIKMVVLTPWEFRPLLKSHPSISFKLLVHMTSLYREAASATELL